MGLAKDTIAIRIREWMTSHPGQTPARTVIGPLMDARLREEIQDRARVPPPAGVRLETRVFDVPNVVAYCAHPLFVNVEG